MKDVQFKDLNVGDKFILNGTEYIRIPDKKVSCCKIFNATNAANPQETIQVKPLTTQVSVND